MKNNRVSAFTIMELTVALLISALVIAMTYTCYTIVSQTYALYRARQARLTELQQLSLTLTRDLEKGAAVTSRPDGLQIGQTSYRFPPGLVLRITATTDTFKINTSRREVLFEGQPATENGLIDELSFDMPYDDQKIPYHYRKTYSAQQLFNNNTDASH